MSFSDGQQEVQQILSEARGWPFGTAAGEHEHGGKTPWRTSENIASGNDCYIATENDLVEIVDFPIKHGDFPQLS